MKLLLAILLPVCLLAQQQSALTDSKLMGLAQAGVSEAELLRMVSSAQNIDFDLRPESTQAMMKAGVSEDVIKAMAGRESGAVAPLASGPAPATVALSSPTTARALSSSPVQSAYPAVHHKLRYDGGSVPNLQVGSAVALYVSGSEIQFLQEGQPVLRIPALSVTEISYGQDVHRRVGTAIGVAVVSFGAGAMLLFAKSKKHFIGITWSDGTTKGGAAFQADKNDYRGVLQGLEGVTGKKAVNSDPLTVRN
jgi:hypothetical protein